MRLAIIAPSGTGKTTAHEKNLSYDVESHPEYEKRKIHFDWNGGDQALKDIRVAYWHAFTKASLDSNLPAITMHHSSEMLAHNGSTRKVVAVYKQPSWDYVTNEAEWNRSRLVALAMNLGSLLSDPNDIPLAEGYVTDLIHEMDVKPYTIDERILEEERMYESHNAAIHALDEKHGYIGGVVI